ncbi:MAG: hypothetical protein ABSE87_11340 [Terracidiphilus sp.]
MNAHDEDRIKTLLQQALPPMEGEAEPGRDLWPAMLGRLNATPDAELKSGWAWFDGALAAALVVLVALFPASIPVLLYYL